LIEKYEMSLLYRWNSPDKLRITKGFLSINALYSRRSNESEESDLCDKKVLSLKPIIKEKRIKNFDEGGPNWEIFNPKGNRFYLPNALGPGWQNSKSTISLDVNLQNLVDFWSKEPDKLQFSFDRCPILLRNNLKELFSVKKIIGKDKELTCITLSYMKHTDIENGAKNFVIAAQEICKRLNTQLYWADFMNPFSGKPFHVDHSRESPKLYTIDKRFRGLGVNYQEINKCLLISSNADGAFSGSIYTNVPHNWWRLMGMLIKKNNDYEY